MGIFNFFGDNEHRVFNYKPMHIDLKAEERKKYFGDVDGTKQKEIDEAKARGEYVPGSSIKGSFHGSRRQDKDKHLKSMTTLVGIFTMILIFIVLYYIAKFYTIL